MAYGLGEAEGKDSLHSHFTKEKIDSDREETFSGSHSQSPVKPGSKGRFGLTQHTSFLLSSAPLSLELLAPHSLFQRGSSVSPGQAYPRRKKPGALGK